ncbi:hypothetical protein A3F28_03790 [Candidatus Uhrbacteria bacterium RIFCSPHIGHO2_12_FULL_57_11]|uniref:Chromosomal replication initiator protein DnaA n=2 Tax=Candidatus Uhriibacteriota TaxID=1752732 RepID=A0A1F7UGF6_9BACT|nr:MAG: hypothetical protein A3D72_02960 [Candidatus Uhrbacteria bacterium RIFCSPHIGHO2_02_FULL_57_19]OGL77361.1 MAG: hypothetical protein A3F28_03790 [Candidatus Uhrbacteria bacterium RIFCSPHIGHO2_12_FULL_57_11]
MTTQQVWQATLGELELSLSKANFTTWFKSTFISAIEGERVVISVPNTFTKTWLEKKYHAAIVKSLQQILNSPIREVLYRVEVKTQPEAQPETKIKQTAASAETRLDAALEIPEVREAPPAQNEFGLRSAYIFENFIVGKGSELAHAAARAVVDNPGTKYNPLFIYGGVGLGKTHILQAIGHALLARNPATRILYATCEQFTNDFINAVRSGRGKEFKDRYRNVDLLLIDDIQFITGKEGTQEEFFHTFNALHQANKQVILTSDRPPKAIPALENRLLSRMEWGMIADITPPDLETRIAILKTKCSERGTPLTEEILHEIAATVASNVRELEGALNKVVAYHQFKNLQVTVESTRNILAGFSQNQGKKSVTAKQLLQTVSLYFDIRIEDLLGKSREKQMVVPRQIAAFLMRRELSHSFPAIGNALGGRDHTTAMHACDKISREVETNQKLKQDIELLRERIYAV